MSRFEYPSRLIAQFPEDVHRNVGTTAVLPYLTEGLDIDKVRAIQFLRSGRVRLTFADHETCEDVFQSGIEYDGLPFHLVPADSRFRTVYLRDLPVEVDDQTVLSFFSDYGEVLSIKYDCFDDFPTIQMTTVLLRSCWLTTSRVLFASTTLIVVFSMLGHRPSVLFVVHLVTVPRPALSLVFVVGVVDPATWPGIVCGLGALFLRLLLSRFS